MNRTKNAVLLCAMLLLGLQISNAQKTNWKLDKSHSSIGFSIDHLVISETVGQFSDYSMSVKSDKEDFTDAKFQVSIDVESIDTKSEDRDKHLRSEDFFNVAKYPKIVFQGESFKKVTANKYKVSGTLTMHGVTKKVVFDAQFGGIVKDPWGGTRAGLKLWGEIDRNDFGLKYNSVLDNGGFAIGNEVRIECRVELIKE